MLKALPLSNHNYSYLDSVHNAFGLGPLTEFSLPNAAARPCCNPMNELNYR